ncbi:hypothetical protein C5E07_16280 [Pseudoclavibacter sp. RFBJ3]|uniref:COG4315 family predicted lipoprotein n=1 Tax=unclassified Pseudoclavibacter TaxID=2615177 RepID=UPI000CE740FC|nr:MULTISPECIES: hypothetical protein [unclassified Pseudoclavibacter]PPF87503.1 hypothetical protein C5C12_00090 [Pseudoclavibacter sp. RFBJ5]PPF90353.1 hypothetical protein C5E07_16280 [Pseudoclavibacter sp. RFBJ3]PPG01038.1 hypothetical protein C5C19_00090 [Pseudoclavibacter sp. RFBH5]PPG26141.1 hypothetical protein C5E13_00045 [Pseudoclavibacter sp. RFBI4]
MIRLRSALAATAVVIAITTSLSGCAPDVGDIDARASAVDVLTIDEIGEVLVDGEGAVLYVFAPDEAEAVSCAFTCATNWPPFVAPEGKSAVAGDGVDQALLGAIANPSGGEVVTYNGWPLYRYAADKQPGEHKGQNLYLNGGDWFVMTPAGEPLRP